MTREDARALAIGCRIGGAALLVVALWLALGGSVGGRYGFGAVLAVVGLIAVFGVPALIARARR